jgi:hypothetical protein
MQQHVQAVAMSSTIGMTIMRLLKFHNGFRTERELAEEDPDEYARICEQKAGRWEMGLGLLSTVDELLDSIE